MSFRLPDLHAIQTQKIVLMHYIQLLKTYQDCMNDLLVTMPSMAESIETYHLLRTIPRVGPLTAAMPIAEIGDIKRFPSFKQLTAFAGLDSAIHESGTFKFKKNRISKRGSSYLRTALYQATVAAISKQIHGLRNSILSAKTYRRQTGKSRNYCYFSQAFTHHFWNVKV